MWKPRSASLLVTLGLAACTRAESTPQPAARAPAAPVAATSSPPVAASSAPAIVPVSGAPSSFVELVKRSKRSVVNIHSTAIIRQRPMAVFPFGQDSPFYELFQ